MRVLDVGENLGQFMDFLNFLTNLLMHKVVAAHRRTQEDDARVLYSWDTMTKRVKVLSGMIWALEG